jgi:NAD(P)H-hydrate epimerase
MDMPYQPITIDFVKSVLKPRPRDTHKYSAGVVTCVCGSYGMGGAVIFSAKAALRCGAGLVRVFLPDSIYPIVASAVPEAVFHPIKGKYLIESCVDEILSVSEKSGALLIGPGLGLAPETQALVSRLIAEAPGPIIQDADGLNALAKHMDTLDSRDNSKLIITPHLGEMERLTGIPAKETVQDKPRYAAEFSKKHGLITVLKGPDTAVADPNGRVMVNTTGNPGMAVGGSGDVLAGMIAALTVQGLEPFDAAAAGVFLHGLAGDTAAKQLSQTAMLPSDMIDELPGIFVELGL